MTEATDIIDSSIETVFSTGTPALIGTAKSECFTGEVNAGAGKCGRGATLSPLGLGAASAGESAGGKSVGSSSDRLALEAAAAVGVASRGAWCVLNSSELRLTCVVGVLAEGLVKVGVMYWVSSSPKWCPSAEGEYVDGEKGDGDMIPLMAK